MIPVDENVSLIIVAHSMGGLVVDDAPNKLGYDLHRDIACLIFRGIASAEAGTQWVADSALRQ
nr:hypothetical protein [Rhodoferax sp.]